MRSSIARGAERAIGEIITFYSYKGGTGRSMALANVAYILATDAAYRGNRVLMIDWDLEAPGLHRFFFKDFRESFGDPGNPSYAAALKEKSGLMDFLVQTEALYRSRFPSEELPESNSESPEAVAVFQEVLRETKFSELPLRVDGIPNLKLLKAGCQDSEYPNKVRKFDWENFYNRYGSFFTHFRGHLMREFDFILIDSRTGLTDTSGICTRVMPEKLVAVFVPNRQNIDGIEGVIRGAAAYRRNSRDVRGLVAFPLASRIDGSASTLRNTWWRGGRLGEEEIEGYEKTFERLFTELYDLDECRLHDYFDATQIPHDSDYSYGESLAARSPSGTSDKLSIGAACANLTRWLVEVSAPWDLLPDPVKLAEAAQRKAEEETQRAQAQTILADEAKRRALEEAARAAEAQRQAEELARREAEARRLVTEAALKAEEQARSLDEFLKRARRTRRVAYSIVGLVLLALLGYGGWIWWLYTDSGRLYYINREAGQLATREGTSNETLLAWALAQVRWNNDEAARAALERIHPSAKNEARLRIAVAWLVAGDLSRAKGYILQVPDHEDAGSSVKDPLGQGVAKATALMRADQGYRSVAESILREDRRRGETDRSPGYTGALTMSALALKEIGAEDWLARLEQALAKLPTAPVRRDMSGMTPEQQGRAIRLERFDSELGSQAARGRVWSWVGHPERAAQTENSKRDQAIAQAYAALGWVAAGDPVKVQEALKQARSLDPEGDGYETPPQWLMRVGVAYVLLGKQTEGEQYLEEAELSYPKQFLALADAWIQAGLPDRALKVAGGISEVHAAAAAALARAGKPDEALQRMTEITNVDRSEPLEAIAVAYSRAGDLKRAVETAARQTNDSSKLQTYAGILAAWKARNDKRWADFDADAGFKDAWTELWWRGWGAPPRMPGGTRSSVW